jgi:S1-C subfamily serine protease
MKTLLTLFLGVAIGFGTAILTGKTEKKVIRLDEVTLKRTELEHVLRAIELLKDKPAEPSFSRYVADSGAVAFECPTEDACNLEVPARDRVRPKELQVTMRSISTIEERKQRPDVAIATGEAVPLVKQSNAETTPSSEGSVFEKLGLRNGDVITAINGEQVKSPSTAFTHLQEMLKESEQLDVTVMRDGRPIKLSYSGIR